MTTAVVKPCAHHEIVITSAVFWREESAFLAAWKNSRSLASLVMTIHTRPLSASRPVATKGTTTCLGWTSVDYRSLEIVVDPILFDHDAIDTAPVPLPVPALLRARSILLDVRRCG